MSRRKISLVTGTRAEWGLLSGLAARIAPSQEAELQIIACNMHLSPEYGETYREIEAAGFTIHWRVDMLLSGDTPTATTKSVGIGTMGFADAYSHLQPDIVVILGDRYEMLAAATAALLFKIPIAHIHGGEITEGAYDDAIRHAITKLSHLHFTSTEPYRKRVIQLGEAPDRVFYVGALGVDNLHRVALMSLDALRQSLDGFAIDRDTLLVTFHPATLDGGSPQQQMKNLLNALERYMEMNPLTKVLFTLPNSDTEGRSIAELIKRWVEGHPQRSVWYTTLGMVRYLSALQYVGAVVGNSSSGIIEVPSFGIPTLDIGDRQRGRITSASVLHCTPSEEDILHHLQQLNTCSYTHVKNVYDKDDTARHIFDTLVAYDLRQLTTKHFYDCME